VPIGRLVLDITEVRIKLIGESDDRLRAFCSITIDGCFVIRDLKIIEGTSGSFVAMPSRKLTAHCPRCGCKNHLKATYCNQCGSRLTDDLSVKDQEGRTKLYADIAHPINSTCREMIQDRVIEEYAVELRRAKEPGYISRYEDEFGGSPEEPTFDKHIDTQQRGPGPPHTSSKRTDTQSDAKANDTQGDDEFGAGIL
jgi:stage V sporulation protein G